MQSMPVPDAPWPPCVSAAPTTGHTVGKPMTIPDTAERGHRAIPPRNAHVSTRASRRSIAHVSTSAPRRSIARVSTGHRAAGA
eukprot:2367928-Rhodomonas_salina.5